MLNDFQELLIGLMFSGVFFISVTLVSMLFLIASAKAAKFLSRGVQWKSVCATKDVSRVYYNECVYLWDEYTGSDGRGAQEWSDLGADGRMDVWRAGAGTHGEGCSGRGDFVDAGAKKNGF